MITLADAKLHLRLDDASEDALVGSLIKAAYRHVEVSTGVTFEQRSMTLALDGFPSGNAPIALPWTPVASIDAVSYTDPDGVSRTLSTFYLDTRPAYPRLSPEHGSVWPKTSDAPESVTITATAGYASTAPDIRAAMLLLIGHWYANREAVAIGTSTSEVPMAVKALISPYCHYHL